MHRLSEGGKIRYAQVCDLPDHPMYLVKFIVLIGILVGVVVSAGCSAVKPSLMPLDSMQDPLVGTWISGN
jgi:hypothetical protein